MDEQAGRPLSPCLKCKGAGVQLRICKHTATTPRQLFQQAQVDPVPKPAECFWRIRVLPCEAKTCLPSHMPVSTPLHVPWRSRCHLPYPRPPAAGAAARNHAGCPRLLACPVFRGSPALRLRFALSADLKHPILLEKPFSLCLSALGHEQAPSDSFLITQEARVPALIRVIPYARDTQETLGHGLPLSCHPACIPHEVCVLVSIPATRDSPSWLRHPRA